ncbi:MAG: hypothetical protein LBB59_07495 [Campylobacteraceae bacterium]|jgi:hypothetical protein|nr:hypothetical protein [Campylobacteraceae bacterium]
MTAKKLATIILIFFLLLFIAYKPYGQDIIYPDNFLKQLFMLYNFVIDNTFMMVHEGGHGVCYILRCPQFITAAAGTVFQLGFPLFLGFISKKQGNIFGFFLGLFFLGFSMQYTAWYISTAHEGLHVSASESFLGIDGYHDFNYILSKFGLVKADWFISGLVKAGGYLIMFYACFKMAVLSWLDEAK